MGISAANIGAGEVSGADSNAATDPNEIKLGTVSTPDLRDLAVSTGKVADKAITAAKLSSDASVDGNRAVGTDHIKDAAVTAAKMASNSVATANVIDKAITDAKLANDAAIDGNRAVGPDHIKTAAVTTTKINDLAVTPAKLAAAAIGTILGGAGATSASLTVGGALTMTVSGSTALFALGGLTAGGAARYASLSVEKPKGTNLVAADFGARLSAAGTFQQITWNTLVDPGGLLSLDAVGTFLIHKVGFYLVFIELDFDTAKYDRLVVGQVNAAIDNYTSFPGYSNGRVLYTFLNTIGTDTRFGVIFQDAAPSGTHGTAINKITTESYAKMVILAL